ncbi:MAG: protein-methionine-sulfoxide reductase catalytic subunit MsrP [Pseudomonadota bacterium]|nr:protein-methionine-sulfoxide reductase catalytic subunit MsrP [Pseudomonadota bacterium]
MDRYKSVFKHSDVTPKETYINRRSIIQGGIAGVASMLSVTNLSAATNYPRSSYSTNLIPNTLEDISSYNNFYEFGTGKEDPSKHAHVLTVKPWSVKVDGLVEKPGNYNIEDIIKMGVLEERIYPFRCVEGWSMVIPWIGFPLSDFIRKIEPKSDAKYVYFETLFRPSEMFGQKYNILDWPYREGLRLDEAMHPLTLLATGLYGDELPKQNGAPLRLVVPWKYGFKSIKSIVRISLTENQPPTSWNMQNPREYGFYSNVNPRVDHPRWTQATERPIGQGLFSKRKKTLLFNGFEREVSSLYTGMDLKKYY